MTELPPSVLHHLRVGRADLRVSVTGEGPPLLLFMGIGASLEMWGAFARELAARGRTLIAIDLPGTGGSPAVLPPMRMAGLVRVATAVLDRLGHDRVDVLGVSFGGGVAQEFARRAPHRTRRLVLAASSIGALGVPAHPRVLIHLMTPFRYWSNTYARRILPDVYGGRARTDAAFHAEMTSRFERPPSMVGYVGQLWAGYGWTSLTWLHRIGVPTLVMAGDDDPIIPTANASILTRLLPDSRLHVVRGGGHLFLLEEAAECADIVDRFLGDSG